MADPCNTPSRTTNGYPSSSANPDKTDPQLILRELEAVFSASYDEIFITDGEGRVLRVNSACKRLYGVDEQQLVGKHVSDLEMNGVFHPSITPIVLRERKAVTLLQTTRTKRRIVVNAQPIFDDRGKIIRIVSCSRDVTEIMDLQQQVVELERSGRRGWSGAREQHAETTSDPEPILCSARIKATFDMARRAAILDSTVLVLGESGSGKEVVARYVHANSLRNRGPFIKINCTTIPETLMESELFGYETGAFTGARRGGKTGLVELADGGTAFFDEIGDVPLSVQTRLLQLLQERIILRVGGVRPASLDVRVIAATNRDLDKMVRDGLFRKDLYYRLNVIPIVVPPLRDRREDVRPLTEHFLGQFNNRYGCHKRVSAEAVRAMESYPWPGNVRELGNIVERAAGLSTCDTIGILDLPAEIRNGSGGYPGWTGTPVASLKEAMEAFEAELVMRAYQEHGSTYKAAAALGIDQSTMVRKLARARKRCCTGALGAMQGCPCP